MQNWPARAGICWLVPDDWPLDHPDAHHLAETALPFTDLLASVDVVIGKCGYGTVAECVVNATPMLYIPRPDWPEEPYLVEWMEQHHACRAISRAYLDEGRMQAAVEDCCALAVRQVETTGAAEIAHILANDYAH